MPYLNCGTSVNTMRVVAKGEKAGIGATPYVFAFHPCVGVSPSNNALNVALGRMAAVIFASFGK